MFLAPRGTAPKNLQRPQGGSADADRVQLIEGLRAPVPRIESKFFYDDVGSRLFAVITALDEYYLTRTETGIIEANLEDIAGAIGDGEWTLVDIGAGDCTKATRLFTALKPRRYIAVDVSASYLAAALDGMRMRYPGIAMSGVATDFTRRIAVPCEVGIGHRLLLFPGSTIGNFDPAEAHALLRAFRTLIDDTGGLLIGVDLVKDVGLLEAAYDDALGVTAAFNLNVLRNANRIAGTDFVIGDWRHVARFDRCRSRMEMHVEARRAVAVRWKDGVRSFAAGERVHTENSYKYTFGGITRLLGGAGFRTQAIWTDEGNWFAVVYARADGDQGPVRASLYAVPAECAEARDAG